MIPMSFFGFVLILIEGFRSEVRVFLDCLFHLDANEQVLPIVSFFLYSYTEIGIKKP